MQKQFLALYDNRPFFERALQYGVKSGIIGQSRLNEILEDGPVGIIQIAETFGEKTANLRPNILAARNRIVNLVSLYLENISEGDVIKGAKILEENDFLSLSKGGSDMVKAIHVLPGTPIIGGQSVSEDLEESYDIYTPDKYIPTELLARYRSARHEKMKNHSTIRACEVFARDFFRLSKEDLAGYNAEGVLTTLVLFSVKGKPLSTFPTKDVILSYLSEIQKQERDWNTVLDKISVIYISDIKKCIKTIENVLSRPSIQEKDIEGLFEYEEYDMDAIETFETRIGEQWEEITEGKNLKREEKLTVLFSWLAGREIKTSITESEAKKMLSLLAESIDEHEQIMEDFIDNTIPFDYQESILALWTILHKEINTLGNKKVPLATKIHLLKEIGCNIKTSSRKMKQKSDKSV